MYFIKIIRALYSLLCTFFYSLIYINKIKINPFHSKFIGAVFIKSGKIHIKNGFSARSGLFLNIDSGLLTIGNNVFINRNTSINCKKKITIGNNVIFGENVKVYDHDHDYKAGLTKIRTTFICKEINIDNNVWIGSNVTILKGVTIGSGAIISAGSIVYQDIPPNKLFIQKKSSELIDIYEK